MSNYRMDHMHLISPDPVKTAEFYEKMLNAKRIAVRERDGRTTVELDIKGTRFKIASPNVQPGATPAPAAPGTMTQYGMANAHFGIRTDNIVATVAELKAKGGKFRDEIRQQATGEKVVFLFAPENVMVELVERSD